MGWIIAGLIVAAYIVGRSEGHAEATDKYLHEFRKLESRLACILAERDETTEENTDAEQ